MNRKKEFDRFAFWVHFVCGAVAGVFIGLFAWGHCAAEFHMENSRSMGWIFMIGSPLLCGLTLGIAKVKYDWDNFDRKGKNW